MSELSTKPYFIRAIYDWCVDSGLTPYLAVAVDEYTQVPMNYVQDGKIVLNISFNAVKNLQIGDEDISCSGRFNGVVHHLMVPVAAVIGIFAKENGHGLVFQGQNLSAINGLNNVDNAAARGNQPPDDPAPPGKPKLRIVK